MDTTARITFSLNAVGNKICNYIIIEKGVALTGRNTTGPPCTCGAIIRRHRLACAGAAACKLAVECYRRQTTTAARDHY